ncbi:MAG: chromate transporter [Lacunisphaera sp.]
MSVLPLLEREIVAPGWVTHDRFLAGYGARKRCRGRCSLLRPIWAPCWRSDPGASPADSGRWARFFLPALLLMAGVLPYWETLRRRRGVQGALRGANAVVVGVLLAALYHPSARPG